MATRDELRTVSQYKIEAATVWIADVGGVSTDEGNKQCMQASEVSTLGRWAPSVVSSVVGAVRRQPAKSDNACASSLTRAARPTRTLTHTHARFVEAGGEDWGCSRRRAKKGKRFVMKEAGSRRHARERGRRGPEGAAAAPVRQLLERP